MSPLPAHRPKQLSLGPLEQEILHHLWQLGQATGRQLHDQILADPDRELTYSSVITVLKRLTKKGWLQEGRHDRVRWWQPRLSEQEAQMWLAHQRLAEFLQVSQPDVIAAFADSLDGASLDQLAAIAQQLTAVRQQQADENPPSSGLEP